VVVDGQPLGKPVDADDARRTLRLLRGRAHEVITGLAVLDAERGRRETSAVVTTVVMGHYDDTAIEAYVASGGPQDKAGSYAIQDVPDGWVTALVGSYTNVVGLPLAETRQLLEAFGVPLRPVSAEER
jgi:septum formation protein